MHENVYYQILGEYILIVDVVIICLIGLSWYYAEQKQITNHRQTIKIIVIGQTILTSLMILRFITSEYAQQFFIHAFFGLLVYLLIIYTYLLMSKKLPKHLKIPKRYRKKLMQTTAILWGISIVIGIISFMFIPD